MGMDVNRERRLETALPVRIARRLERSGPLGHALLAMPGGVDPEARSRARSLDVRDLIDRRHLAPPSDRPLVRRVAGAVSSTADANSGLFGLILVGSAIGLGGVAWTRRRPYF